MHATIIENSLADKGILKKLTINKTYTSGTWILHEVEVNESLIPELAKSLTDKGTWKDAVEYGRSLGIPEEQKKKMEEAKPMMPKMYAAQFVLSFLTSFAVVLTVTMSIKNGTPTSTALGFPLFNWLCFMVPIIGSGILWSNCDRSIAWKKFFSDIFSNFVTILVIAGLAVAFVK